MKKLFTVGIMVIGLTFYSNTNLHAQDAPGDMSIGGGFAYGLDIEELGLQLNGTYRLNEEMRLGADIIYWFTEDTDAVSTTFFQIDGNFHYIFHTQEDLIVYGIGSLGLHFINIDFEGNDDIMWGGYGGSETELGLGIGIGAEYNLGGVSLFAEPRFFLSGFEQLELAAGVRFGI